MWSKNILTIGVRRQWVNYGLEKYKLSVRQACRTLSSHLSVYRYLPKPKDDETLRGELLQLAARKTRWGFKKMDQYLRNQGNFCNHKRVRRVCCDLGLNLRAKPRNRLPVRDPRPLQVPETANVSWSLDFMHDSLANGRPIRALNIIDDVNREGLWIEVDACIPSARVIRILSILALGCGYPKQLRTDNGPEFISKALARWAAEHQVELAFITTRKTG